MLRIFKTKNFHRWARKERISDSALKDAINEIIAGVSMAELGSGLFKKRIARAGSGKRGGYRSLLAFKQGSRIIFMFGFSKSERENIDKEEKELYRKLATFYLGASDKQIKSMCDAKDLIEVNYE